jgi:hypothetical protein
MQNLAMSNSESKKLQQKHSSSGMAMMDKSKQGQNNQNFSGRYTGTDASIMQNR